VAYTAPGIVAHQPALKGGALLRIPVFAPPSSRDQNFKRMPISMRRMSRTLVTFT
jgi:hypothetical protein